MEKISPLSVNKGLIPLFTLMCDAIWEMRARYWAALALSQAALAVAYSSML